MTFKGKNSNYAIKWMDRRRMRRVEYLISYLLYCGITKKTESLELFRVLPNQMNRLFGHLLRARTIYAMYSISDGRYTFK